MCVTFIKQAPRVSIWIVKSGDRFLGEVSYHGPYHWGAETMDGRKFRARSKRNAVQLLKIDAAKADV
jgi:hypothetical protein